MLPLRSLELAKEYDTTKTALDKATTLSTESFHSKREVAKEFKAFKEHQSESKRLTKLWQDKVRSPPSFSVLFKGVFVDLR